MVRFAPAVVDCQRRPDGTLLLSSPLPLAAHERSIGARLVRWAERTPERTFVAERRGDGWRRVGYGAALGAVRALATWLLELGLGPTRPLMLLSGNGVDHALLTLAAMHVGVPAAPVSPAYSLASQDFAKLRAIAAQLAAGAIFVDDRDRFAGALAAVAGTLPVLDAAAVAARACAPASARVDDAFAAVGPDSIAKVLFTSGSTGAPKGVVNTQRMLTSNQQAIAQLWPFLAERPPVTVDWLPWSHTFGGNHNFHMMLWHGGSLFVDGGKPTTPDGIATTVANLRAVSPTIYFNVPRGFDVLLPALEADVELRARFFADLDLVFYAAAALPDALWRRLESASLQARGKKTAMTAAWGATETSPLATQVHFAIDRAGVIGLPAPGVVIKLAPVGDRLELRVRGPNVTPGFWEPGGRIRPVALDDEGFLPTGDAGKLYDAAEPARGLVFDGRIAENFKLSSGTWVAAGALRVGCIAACDPLLQDAVVCGHDRDFVALMLFVNPTLRAQLGDDEVRRRIAAALAARNGGAGSAASVRRALVLDEPPSIDAGEITDKGYLNQRTLRERRANWVEALFAEPPPPSVIVISG